MKFVWIWRYDGNKPNSWFNYKDDLDFLSFNFKGESASTTRFLGKHLRGLKFDVGLYI